MNKPGSARQTYLLVVKGSENQGEACRAMARNGFNRAERDVVAQTATWIVARQTLGGAPPFHLAGVRRSCQTISKARKSFTLVNVGPGTTRSPSGWKKW